MARNLKETIKKIAGAVETDPTEALRKHLKLINVNSAIESKHQKISSNGSTIMGSVRLEQCAIDLIELELLMQDVPSLDNPDVIRKNSYRCNYWVQIEMEGLADKLEAHSEPVSKGLFSHGATDFRWVGSVLADVLNTDRILKNMLYQSNQSVLKDKDSVWKKKWRPDETIQLPRVCIKPCTSHWIKITQDYYYSSPESAFPSIPAFESYDKIAQHIRYIVGESARKRTYPLLEHEAIGVLAELHAFFAEHDIRVWLEQGTLIDAVLEKRVRADTLIEDWARPLKMGFRFQDAASLLKHISCLENRGYNIQIHDSAIDLKKGSIKVNIKGYQLKSQDETSGIMHPSPYWYVTYINGDSPRSKGDAYGYWIPHHFFESLDKVELHQLTWNVPSQVQSYLEYRYGKEWRGASSR